MSHWEATGKSDEWYTPKYVFDALGCHFDLDVAHPYGRSTNVPAKCFFSADGLTREWTGFVWMNPPFGGRNSIAIWLDKFFEHGNGIALTPDRTSAPWWQDANRDADAVLFVKGKVKFERSDGMVGKSPSTGTTLFADGPRAVEALLAADRAGLGAAMCRASNIFARQAA